MDFHRESWEKANQSFDSSDLVALHQSRLIQQDALETDWVGT